MVKGGGEDANIYCDGTILREIVYSSHNCPFLSLSQVYLSFEVLLAVHGTSQVFSTKVPVAPNPPELKITGPDKIGLGDEAKVRVTFVNPLPVKMENITLNVESDELLNGEGEGVEGGGGKEKTLMVKGDDVRMERGEGGGEGGEGSREG